MWFYKTALENYDQALFQIGHIYRISLCVSEDSTIAVKLYKKTTCSQNRISQTHHVKRCALL
jgi:hypothetical protein